jgi:hypothetical protein
VTETKSFYAVGFLRNAMIIIREATDTEDAIEGFDFVT